MKSAQMVKIKDIKLGDNSRQNVSDIEIQQLMASIKEVGILQPIGLVARKEGGYEVIFGNRRFVACKNLGMHEIPAIVRDIKHESDVEIQNLTENIQRKDISLIEIGRYIELLKEEYKLRNDEIAVRLGMSKNYIRDAAAAYQRVPKSFRKDIDIKSTNDRTTSPGKISLKTTKAILTNSTKMNLTKAQTNILFKEAKENENFQNVSVKNYAAALANGSTKPVEDVSSVKTIAIQIVMDQKHYDKLYKEHVVNGAFASFSDLLVSVLRGEKSITINARKRVNT